MDQIFHANTNTDTDRHTHRHRLTHTDRHREALYEDGSASHTTGSVSATKPFMQTQTDKHRQTDRQTDRQTGRHREAL